jgi:hypothetical protein
MATTAVEQRKTRADLAQLAGRGPFSLIATLAGALVGYATFALLTGGAAAVVRASGSEVDLTGRWDTLGAWAGLVLGGLLFVSYLFAGYVAGRMGWRRGWLHGLVVFLGSIVIIGGVALLVRSLAKPDQVERVSDAFRSFGIPTTRDEWRNVDSVVGIASLGGMLLGSILGGVLGERWFTKVSRSALEAEVDVRERMEASNERLAPVTTTNGNGRRARTRTADEVTDVTDKDEVDVDDMTKDELYHQAQELDIPGRSQMTKDQLKDAVQQRS